MLSDRMISETRKSVHKLVTLRKTESWAQEKWKTEQIFEVEAPRPGEDSPEKYFGTFPYPYMNGLLHLGHAFTLAKVEFTTSYERMKGKRVLFPFAFHLTGMPIKASADKINNEVEKFGKFFDKAQSLEQSKKDGDQDPDTRRPPKVAAKEVRSSYQFEILKSMDIPLEEIHQFADTNKWIEYFPPKAVEDLKSFGLGIDWRRTFVTTDANPYYDSFIKWQMRKLLNCPDGLVFEGERPTVYSPLDQQPCLDHDRSVGEGIGIQEYTCIKIQVLIDEVSETPSDKRFNVNGVPVGETLIGKAQMLKGRELFLVAATLRPETMYGQVCCYISPTISYGVFAVNEKEAWICTDRSARNIAHQGKFEKLGEVNKLFSIKGRDLIGLPLKAPLAMYDKLYALPYENVVESVGTGIVTSVPSDSPDDLINLKVLSKKHKFYGVCESWVTPFLDNYPRIIETEHGSASADYCLNKFNIQSQKDKVKLENAKAYIYKESFYNGVMLVGDYKGMKVCDAKPLIRQKLIDGNMAFAYAEPAGKVISRSGDECVVRPCHQWFLNYGENRWKAKALECLNDMKLYSKETYNAFVKNLDWLGPWACCREFGLGTRLPWDEKYLVESLSDSTIYMAYYTVAHLLHCNSLNGKHMGQANIRPEDTCDYMWDYVFCEGEYKEEKGISKEVLDLMRREFNYFYPLDIRCSGKDLIFNHLTFCIYIHTAIFPKRLWPRSFLTNGHVLLNGEKMSKSTGNFLTLNESVAKYGSDATRIGLADAGDGLDDANFVEKVTDNAILKLYADRVSAEILVDGMKNSIFRQGEYTMFDRMFRGNLAVAVEKTKNSYENALFRDCVKYSFYGISSHFTEYCKLVKNHYKSTSKLYPAELHHDLVKMYLEVSALTISPICPHWSEYVWTALLGNEKSVRVSKWPEIPITVEDTNAVRSLDFIKSLLTRVRSEQGAKLRKLAKAKPNEQPVVSQTESNTLYLFTTEVFPEWELQVAKELRENWDSATNDCTTSLAEIVSKTSADNIKSAMLFATNLKQKAQAEGPGALELRCDLNQEDAINSFEGYILDDLSYLSVNKLVVNPHDGLMEGAEKDSTNSSRKKVKDPYPGIPSYEII